MEDEKVQAVADHLAKLGELAPDEIARLFRDEQITGQHCAPAHCPVANWLRRETGQSVNVLVHRWGFAGHSVFHGLPGVVPETVGQFVKAFDRTSQYDDLAIEPENEA